MLVRSAMAVLLVGGCAPGTSLPADEPTPGERRRVVVSSIVDGDTIRVGTERIRLIGIDTPELDSPEGIPQCLAVAAARFTSRELEGRAVELELDVDELDPYGRTLAYVWKGVRLFNETLVERGLAEERPYPPNTKHQERLHAAEARARAAPRGIWGRCVSVPG
ncbi:MAG TPA: thermonuclease family protein [Actinomycetota bacterium]|nr:thermonuclease family protein [Actinomycetota bacterium]